MKILNRIAFRYLKLNKSRTLITIIGIIISAAMITAVTTTISSFKAWIKEGVENSNGVYHLYTDLIDCETADKISAYDDIKSHASYYLHTYAKNDSLKKRIESFHGYFVITTMSEGFGDVRRWSISEGRAPENENEIMLPSSLYVYVENAPLVGERITFDTGVRKTLDGLSLTEGTFIILDEDREDREYFEKNGSHEYTVVGYYDSSKYSFGLESIYSSTLRAVTGKCDIKPFMAQSYLSLKNAKCFDDFILRVFEDNGEDTTLQTNYDYLSASGAIKGSGYDIIFVSLGSTLIFIIAIASLSLIGSAFSISITERTKQFGLLASIGATKKQIKRSVIAEAMLISFIAIPIGILAGLSGMAITFACIKDNLHTMLYEFTDSKNGDVIIRIVPSFWAILIAIIGGFATVYISALLPARRAMKMAPLDAIKSSKDVKINPRALKTSRLTGKLLGVEGMLASKYFKRSKKKYRATVISISLSVLLFVLAGTFTSYLGDLLHSTYSGYEYDYRSILHTSPHNIDERDDVVNALLSETRFKDVLVTEEYHADFLLNKEDVNPKWYREDRRANLTIITVDDASFLAYLKSEGLDKDKYMNPENREFLFSDIGNYTDTEAQRQQIIDIFKNEKAKIECAVQHKFYNFSILSLNNKTGILSVSDNNVKKEIPLREYQGYISFNLDKRINTAPAGYNGRKGVIVYIPACAAESLLSNTEYKAQSSHIYVNAYNPTEDYPILEQIVRMYRGGYNILNQYEEYAGIKALFFVFKVLSYGFIILMSLISLINMFSIISTNIYLRRRDFAILASVGMSHKGTVKMMMYECFLYGSKGLIYGIPLSLAASVFISLKINDAMETDIILPTGYILVSIVAVFAVIALSMLYSISKIKKDNTVETVRNENV